MLPTHEDVENALNVIAMSDESYSKLFAAKDAQKERIKLFKGRAFLKATGTVGERNAIADSHPDVEQAINEWENTVADYKLLESQRKLAELKIDVWRSAEASRRKAF